MSETHEPSVENCELPESVRTEDFQTATCPGCKTAYLLVTGLKESGHNEWWNHADWSRQGAAMKQTPNTPYYGSGVDPYAGFEELPKKIDFSKLKNVKITKPGES